MKFLKFICILLYYVSIKESADAANQVVSFILISICYVKKLRFEFENQRDRI